MEMIIQILIAGIAAIGLALILADVFKIPKYPVSKAITSLGKRGNKKPVLSISGSETFPISSLPKSS